MAFTYASACKESSPDPLHIPALFHRSPFLPIRPWRIASKCSSLLRFCKATSIHFTTMGLSIPSHVYLLSRAVIAAIASSLLFIVMRPQPLVVGAPWKALKRFTSQTCPNLEKRPLTSSSVAVRSTLAKKSCNSNNSKHAQGQCHSTMGLWHCALHPSMAHNTRRDRLTLEQ